MYNIFLSPMIYRTRPNGSINCLNGREWLWPECQLTTLAYGPWPTSELSRSGKSACLGGGRSLSLSVPVSLSVSLSVCLSLSVCIYIYMIYIYMIYIYMIYIYNAQPR